jgi:hypothetical protein
VYSLSLFVLTHLFVNETEALGEALLSFLGPGLIGPGESLIHELLQIEDMGSWTFDSNSLVPGRFRIGTGPEPPRGFRIAPVQLLGMVPDFLPIPPNSFRRCTTVRQFFGRWDRGCAQW